MLLGNCGSIKKTVNLAEQEENPEKKSSAWAEDGETRVFGNFSPGGTQRCRALRRPLVEIRAWPPPWAEEWPQTLAVGLALGLFLARLQATPQPCPPYPTPAPGTGILVLSRFHLEWQLQEG